MNILRTMTILICICTPIYSQTVDEIVDKYINALGGHEKLRSIQSSFERFTINGGVELTVWKKKPNEIRIEWKTADGRRGTECFNGEIAWEYIPYNDNPNPFVLSGVQAKALERASRFENKLLDYMERGIVVQFLGDEDIETDEAHVLLLTMADEHQEYFYIDVESGLLVKTFTFVEIHASKDKKPQTRWLSDYRASNGIMSPGNITMTAPGVREVKVWKAREYNTEIEDSIFALPKENPLK